MYLTCSLQMINQMQRWQKRITLTPDNLDYVLKHFNKIHLTEIAGNIGETYNKVRKNLILFGLISKNPKPKYFNDREFQF